MQVFPDAKILDIDLSSGTINRSVLPAEIYRQYPGGSALGVYLIMREMDPQVDPLSPEAMMVFSVSPLTGLAFAGNSRLNVAAKSPLTGGMGDSQSGGYFPAALKSNGYDAIIFRGRAKEPVYLNLDGEKAELRSAQNIWGKTTGDAEAAIHADLGTDKVEIVQIGPAGENGVLFSALIHMCTRANGRNGLGAVMGSKNLKAVVAAKAKPRKPVDEANFKPLAQAVKQRLEEDCPVLNNIGIHGTNADLAFYNSDGFHPYKNWQYTYQDQEHADKITGETISDTVLKSRQTCYACAVRCKRVVEIEERGVEGKFGGPEYETAATFGSYCGVDDLGDVCLANQLCNQYGLDTISCGATFAFAMEAFEKGYLTAADTDGVEFRFGDGSVFEKMIPMIAQKQGFGAIMAEGSGRMAERYKAPELFMGVKNQEFPAHMPQFKPALGLVYAVNPYGADHQSCEHDGALAAPWDALDRQRLAELGIFFAYEDPACVIDENKALFALISQQYVSMLDSLCLCQFPFAPTWGVYGPADVVHFLEYGLGYEISLYELMMAGMRRINMMRWFNAQCGFTSKEDVLPKRVFEKIPNGPQEGRQLSEADFYESVKAYYRFAGWDEEGRPTPQTLKTCGLEWLVQQ